MYNCRVIENGPIETPSSPPLHVDLAQVCVVDGNWQDMPEQVGAFDEAQLGALAAGRGRIYILLDVSGEIEGRGEVERELIETVRREYAARGGSISFGLSEAIRSANNRLYESNLAAAREARRMAGISVVVLRGQDLYVGQAGPAVVYAELSDVLNRYPEESDWFSQDQPKIAPEGKASAPLGTRRDVACDLFHATVAAGDVFVLATRALTQLATTEELAQAFTNRGAEDIANLLEDIANGSDLCALVGELVDPRDLSKPGRQVPPVQVVPEFGMETQGLEPEIAQTALEPAQAAEPAPEAPMQPEPNEEELARLREERKRRRAAQIGAVGGVVAGIAGALAAILLWLGRALAGLLGLVDWERLGGRLNRLINMLSVALWRAAALLVRMILPGAPSKQAALLPRRASKEPLWLRGVAVFLPVLFAGLAFGIYKQQGLALEKQAVQLVSDADKLEQAAENNPNKSAAREQLNQALVQIRQARDIADTADARKVYYKIEDQLSQVEGIAVLYDISKLAAIDNGGSGLAQLVVDGSNVYVFDRGAQRVYRYVANESVTKINPASGDGTMLKVGDKADNVTVDRIRGIAWADAGSGKAGLVAVTGRALLQYDAAGAAWHATVADDAAQWGDIRAVSSFLGNIYLLDAGKNQIWKYVPSGDGYSKQAAPYLPANSSVPLSQAAALSIDGEVWVLSSDGSIVRFLGSQRSPFDLSGLDTPLKNPVAIYTRPEIDSIYIADAGNRRFVEIDKNGRFVRAFKPQAEQGDAFNSLESLLADEAAHKFYFASGATIYAATLPR